MKTTKIGPFAGISNRRPTYALIDEDKGFFVPSANNVYLTNAGTFVVRREPELIQAMSAPHSLFRGLMVRGGSLYSVTLPTYAETFKKVLSNNSPMSYAEINGSVYYSNGTDSGRIDQAGVVRPWGLPTPSSPTLSVISGSLLVGKYNIAISYSNEDTGEEGGVSSWATYDLASAGAIRVQLPGATDGATHVNIYASSVNGSDLTLQSTVAASTTSADITAITHNKREISQRVEQPLPAGSRIFEFNGCLCSVNGKELYVGLPYRHGYYLPLSGRVSFPENISIATGNQSGIYVAADKTYLLAGNDPSNSDLVNDVLPYGAIAGTEFTLTNEENIIVGWMGEKGFVLASSDGSVKAVTDDEVSVSGLPSRGVSIVFESDNLYRVYSCGYCMNLRSSGMTTFTGYDITSYSNGYVTKSDGVYLAEGSLPAPNYIINLGKNNFGSEELKHIPSIYIGASSGDKIGLRITTRRQGAYEYLSRSYSEELGMHRIDPGRGLKDSWFELELFSDDPSFAEIASISFNAPKSTRRI